MNHSLLSTILLAASLVSTILCGKTVAASRTDGVASCRVCIASRDTSYTNLKEATVTTTRLVFVTKKDTVIYDMDALDATKGDLLGDMIDRMPGLELRDGVLYFKGRAVSRLLVNGTDFVRGDTKTALSTLPAYIIKNLKAYEDKTEQAKITGIDDGVREQVVDVILKREYLGEWVGNADLGGGTDERWRIRAFVNTFTDNRRLTVYGGFTNTGQYQSVGDNGSWGDNGGAGGSSGNTKYMRPGFSYMWHNKKHQGEAGYFKFDAAANWDWRGHKDYFYNEQETYLGDGTSKYSVSDSRVRNDERIWQGSMYFTYEPTKTTHIEYWPRFTYNRKTDRSSGRTGEWTTPVYERTADALDRIAASGNEGWPADSATYYKPEESRYDNRIYYYSHWFYATQRLTENNWRLSLRNSLSYDYSPEDGNTLTAYRYFGNTSAPMSPLYNRYQHSDGNNFNLQNFLDLNIPLKFLETLCFTYGFTVNRNHNDTHGFRLDTIGGIFADYDAYAAHLGLLPETADWRQLSRDRDVTLNSTRLSRKHWAELQFQYNKRGLYLSMQNTVRFAYDRLNYEKIGYDPLSPSRHVTEYVHHTQMRYETDSIGKFSLKYYYEISPQDLGNEITIPNTSDPLNISLGNPGMKNKRYHNVSFSYDRTFRGNRWIAYNASWELYKHTATSRSTYDKVTGVNTTQPVTIEGTWKALTDLSYSQPLDKKQHATIDVGIGYSVSNEPTYSVATDGVPVRRTDTYHQLGLNARLNLRYTKFLATIRTNGNFTTTHSTLANSSGHKLWRGRYTLSAQYTFPLDICLKTDLTVHHRTGVASQTLKEFTPIWNAYLSKSFLRDKSLTLQIEASDILNKRDQSWAWSSTSSRGYSYTVCVSRFFMLHLIYSFSTKK